MPFQIEYNLVPEIDYFIHRRCGPNWRISEQFLPIYDLTYLLSGSARYTINGISRELSAGDLLCVPANSIRAGITFPDRLMHCFAVDFALKDGAGKAAALPFPLVSRIGMQGDIIHLFQELDFAWLDKQPGYTIKTRGFLLLILHRLFELIEYKIKVSQEDPRIKKIMYYITNHYFEKITVQKMAAMVGLNEVYCGALFRAKTGLSMHRYIIKTRIRNAENMLKSGEYSVKDAAEHCGFSDIYHFYKQFKALMGFSPSKAIPKKGL
ncbi:MAG: AraC family transcriptional regulator [Treponema sp.]|jgi:AraC-like DNA-binding protein|nr:AraC family transcriptional regulator [Treponema sp.]